MKIKKLYSFCRLLHIYISTALFSLLIFFCVSGLLLNHLSWIADDEKTSGMSEGKLPTTVTQVLHRDLTAVNAIVAIQPYITEQYQLTDLAKFDWDKDTGELILDYPVPAGYALVIVDTVTFQYVVEYQQANLLSILNDLHKGRHSGKAWSFIIDLSAILICLFSFTGLVILFQNKKKRYLGAWCTVFGTLTPVVIYLFFVPRLTGVI